VLDSTLSCGSVDKAAVGMVKEWGVKKIKLCVIVASPEGIEAFHAVGACHKGNWCTHVRVTNVDVYACGCSNIPMWRS
jgi:hypothetical protein